MTITLSALPPNERAAAVAVNQLNLEGLVTANVISTFRNVFPSVSNFLEDMILGYEARDNVDYDFTKRTRAFTEYQENAAKMNFVANDAVLVAVPQGLTSKYTAYLGHLVEAGDKIIKERDELLADYRRVLSNFISNSDGKTSLRDYTRVYKDIENRLDEQRKHLASYFNDKHVNTMLPLYAVFDRNSDIADTVNLAKKANGVRLAVDRKDIMGNVKDISSLLNLVIQRSNEEGINNVSAAAANSIAQGAMAVAHYVEFLGVFRYRLEEAISAVGQMAEKIASLKNVG